jgi:hypothetical protein
MRQRGEETGVKRADDLFSGRFMLYLWLFGLIRLRRFERLNLQVALLSLASSELACQRLRDLET